MMFKIALLWGSRCICMIHPNCLICCNNRTNFNWTWIWSSFFPGSTVFAAFLNRSHTWHSEPGIAIVCPWRLLIWACCTFEKYDRQHGLVFGFDDIKRGGGDIWHVHVPLSYTIRHTRALETFFINVTLNILISIHNLHTCMSIIDILRFL